MEGKGVGGRQGHHGCESALVASLAHNYLSCFSEYGHNEDLRHEIHDQLADTALHLAQHTFLVLFTLG